MPIGKNAIKRISNNGYSSVTTSAPDMENSVVNEERKITQKKQESAKKTAPVAKIAPKADTNKASSAKSTAPKPTAKKAAPKANVTSTPKEASKSTLAPQKSMETEPTFSPVNTAEKITATAERKDEGYINLGGELPVHLL